MKRIIIVNNNMKVGGVQKSLCNLLWELEKDGRYDVTLVLFSPVGEYLDRIPPNIKCIYPNSLFRYIGVSQGEMHGVDVIKRGMLAAICRIFGRSAALAFMTLSQKRLPGSYDCAVAFLHNGRNKSFFGGVQEFVLNCIEANRKVAFLHDDYNKCGANHKSNNEMMARFDIVASCSNGCRMVFESAVPSLKSKSVTVRNCNNIEEIRFMAEVDTVVYEKEYLNVICAARLSPRKGIDRAIEATAYVLEKGIPMKLHVLGSGVMEDDLKCMVRELNLDNNVHFYGEQSNPYRFMKNANLFLLASYHEAAPMVIDEAYILGVPTLTTRTNSSDEMVTERKCGWVCENDQQSLNLTLYDVLSDINTLNQLKKELSNRIVDNTEAKNQFIETIGV